LDAVGNPNFLEYQLGHNDVDHVEISEGGTVVFVLRVPVKPATPALASREANDQHRW
jgi:hypothetical protein